MTRENPYRNARPDSFAATIRVDSPQGCRIALLGLADDAGVSMNGGRRGAKDGPRAFREALSRYGGTHGALEGGTRLDLDPIHVFDAGDVQPGGSFEATHEAVSDRVTELLDKGLLIVCIGGGHDLTWAAVRAVARAFPDLSGVYFDAHLDVRETPGSGMPFRKILTETSCRELVVCGLDAFANSREHLEWFEGSGGRLLHGSQRPFENLRSAHCFASFDLDVINVSHAPGVSAINVTGWDAAAADRIALLIGQQPNLRYFDIMELNPKFDIDGRTARLAARLFLSFIAGLAQRVQS